MDLVLSDGVGRNAYSTEGVDIGRARDRTAKAASWHWSEWVCTACSPQTDRWDCLWSIGLALPGDDCLYSDLARRARRYPSASGCRNVRGKRDSFWRIIGRIWRPGAAVGLEAACFAAQGAFFSLDVLCRGWPDAGLGLTLFCVGFVLVRLLLAI